MKQFVVTTAVSSLAVCASFSATAVGTKEVKAASGYHLVWSDEFNGTELNRDNWNVLTGNGGTNPGWGNNELEYYMDSEKNVFVEDGKLKIRAIDE